ncbi:uncharacterized protein METZ01_LOCUS441904, partial [marine metagenome]
KITNIYKDTKYKEIISFNEIKKNAK